MKILLALCLMVAAVSADAPLPTDYPTQRKYNTDPVRFRAETWDPSNQFSSIYGTNDGTIVRQRGILVPTPDGTDFVQVFEGEFEFIENGRKYVTSYVADKDGYRAVGDHLPVAPASPPAPNF